MRQAASIGDDFGRGGSGSNDGCNRPYRRGVATQPTPPAAVEWCAAAARMAGMRRRIVVIVAALTATAIACSDDEPRTQTAYCDAARANAAALTNPQIRTTADLDAIAALEHIAGNDLNTFSAVLSQIQLLWHILGFKKEIEAQGFPDILVTAKVNSLVEQDQWTSMDRFAELDQPEYDAVIGNPPYVRAERSAQALDKRSQYEFERGRDGFPGISSKLNSYALFLYRALDRGCKPADPDGHAGKVGFVLPVSLFDSNDTAPLRKLFAIGGRWAMREIVDLDGLYRQVSAADVLP